MGYLLMDELPCEYPALMYQEPMGQESLGNADAEWRR
jgi:hypothetical protein